MVTRGQSRRVNAVPLATSNEPNTHIPSKVMNLLIEAQDRADDLLYVQHSLSAFTKLVAAEYEKPRARLEADRGELTALLTIINEHASKRIQSAIAAVEAAGLAAKRSTSNG